MLTLESIQTAHLIATLMLAGLIWFVQLVHYPLMARVGREGFTHYEREHMRRTTWIVAPLMLTEALCAVALLWLTTGESARTLAWVGAGLLAVIWLSTALVQVPCHERLAKRFDAGVVSRLVNSNWIRTAAWTGRAAIAVLLLALGRT